MITVRTLAEHENLPGGFNTGYENMPVMKDWVWVAEDEIGVCGVLLAAPCHGLVYMMRVCIKKYANPMAATILIRAFMKDCQKRRFKGYFFHVSTMTQTERDLIPIVRKAGGVQITAPQLMLVGSIEKAVRF